jgi:hypothetical protein
MAINPLQPPINYAGMAPQINIGQQFAELSQVLLDRQKRTQAEEVKKTYATDLQNAIANPTQETWSQMIAKYPQQREAFTEARKGYGEVAATNEFNQGFEVSMLLENKKPEVAKQKLLTIISARENSKLPTGIYKQTLDELESGNIQGAQAGVNYALTMLDPDRFTKQVNARVTAEKAPSAVLEAVSKAEQERTTAQEKVADLRIKLQNEPIEAERLAIKRDLELAQADKAKVDAEFARAKTVLEVQQQAATLRKTNEDIIINKENARIAALNAAIARETNVIKRADLQQKIDDAKEKRDAADRDQKATVANQSADIDNFLNTAVRILQTPKDVIASATGPVASRLPTLSADVSDFEALVEALGSQAFIAQIPKIKGTGSLSEKEGDKLQASLQTLSLKQSPARLEENVKEAVRLLTKVRENIAVKYGVQAPPLDVPASELNVTVGGATYNFPTKAAADAFKNTDAYRRAAGTR